jgi:hypothetical protein
MSGSRPSYSCDSCDFLCFPIIFWCLARENRSKSLIESAKKAIREINFKERSITENMQEGNFIGDD